MVTAQQSKTNPMGLWQNTFSTVVGAVTAIYVDKY